jgi:hypothetical protein
MEQSIIFESLLPPDLPDGITAGGKMAAELLTVK